MAEITFQVVEGLEAGRIFRGLTTPLTMGREEDNDIQLNDERISRFHAKVQEDSGRLILTDLESTNGTRVNGHPVRMRVLQPGDLVMIGRCVLLVGDSEELRDRAEADVTQAMPPPESDPQAEEVAFPNGPPPLPDQLSALQSTELSDLLEYIRTELIAALSLPVEELQTDDPSAPYLRVSRGAWRRLQLVLPQLSEYINQISSPAED